MARPTKEGLDYFPLDVTLDDKFTIIEAQHGLPGFAICIKLLQKIYSEGYYYAWGEMEQILFSNAVSSDISTVTSIVSDCVKWGLFSKVMYEKYNILTSKGIQERYVTAVYKRKEVEMISEYLLVDVSERANIACISITDDGNEDASRDTDGASEDVSEVSGDESAQSKVNKSKVKESKRNQSKVNKSTHNARARDPSLDDFDKFWDLYPNKVMPEQSASLWLSINPDEDTVLEIMEGLGRWLASDQWERGVYQSPVNWLRDRRWLDEPPSAKKSSGNPFLELLEEEREQGEMLF